MMSTVRMVRDKVFPYTFGRIKGREWPTCMTSELNDVSSSPCPGGPQLFCIPRVATMALLEESQDIETDGTRQSNAAIPVESRKTADVTGCRDDQALVDRLMRRVPGPLQSTCCVAVKWLRGPQPPQAWKIRPFLPRLQQLPLRFVDKVLPRQWQRVVALFVFYVCWIATFGAVLRTSYIVDDVDGYGPPALLECGSTFWYGQDETLFNSYAMFVLRNQTGPRIMDAASMVPIASLSRTAPLPSAALQVVPARRSSILATLARRRSSMRPWLSAVRLRVPLRACIVVIPSFAQLPYTPV